VAIVVLGQIEADAIADGRLLDARRAVVAFRIAQFIETVDNVAARVP